MDGFDKIQAEADAAHPNGQEHHDWTIRVAELALMPPIEFDRIAKAEAKAMGCKVSTLEAEVAKARPHANGGDGGDIGRGRELKLEPIELWPDPVAGEKLAAEIEETFGRFVALPEHAAVAVTLWVMHTHAFTASTITPKLNIASPVKRCGKTVLLGLLSGVAAKPMMCSSISASAIFRVIEAVRPTLLIDEGDTFLNGDNAEELRGILNSGHRRTGEAIRVEERAGERVPMRYSTWAPVALAGIGKLGSTLADRSITIRMERRMKVQTVERWRVDRIDDFLPLARRCARWAADHHVVLSDADPEIPTGLHDRACDNWRPLLAIADKIGGEWPATARAAALALSGGDDDEVWAIMLLEDIRSWWLNRDRPPDEMGSTAIVSAMKELEHRPWAEMGKAARPLTVQKLAVLLRPFGVAPTRREYKLTAFDTPWTRYLPPFEPHIRTDPSK